GEEGGNFSVGDHPVVVHLGAERMVEGETDRFLLLGGEAFVERRDERFGTRPFCRSLFSVGNGQRRNRIGGQSGRAGDGGFEESPASDTTAALAIVVIERLC